MNELTIFNSPEFGQVRMVEIGNKPYAVASDVAKALEYAIPHKAVRDHCKGVLTWNVLTKGGEQQVLVIPEGDIYRLIVKAADQSRNQEIKVKAERFERWIFDEVIPSIRNTGSYGIQKTPRNDDEIILLGYQKLMGKVHLLEGKVAEMEPKALFADSVSNSKNSILVADLAKILKQNGIEIGEVRLFKWMRDNGYLGKQNSYYNKPTQKAMELGLFHIKETTVTHSDGRTSVSITPKVTGKGQIYFVSKFREERDRLNVITASNM